MRDNILSQIGPKILIWAAESGAEDVLIIFADEENGKTIDTTRVEITEADPDIPGSDYINANYIRNKCVRYWPDPHTTKEFGNVQVKNVEEHSAQDYILRKLEVTRLDRRNKMKEREYSNIKYPQMTNSRSKTNMTSSRSSSVMTNDDSSVYENINFKSPQTSFSSNTRRSVVLEEVMFKHNCLSSIPDTNFDYGLMRFNICRTRSSQGNKGKGGDYSGPDGHLHEIEE
ncbi:hypothetical protein PAMP_011683 [Pampus punctatissimus]